MFAKIVVFLRENWDIMPKFLKVQLLEALHQNYSLREMARLLNKPPKTLHWYLKYQTKDSTKHFLAHITGQQCLDNHSPNMKQLYEIIEQLLSKNCSDISDPVVKQENGFTPSNSGDDENITHYGGDKHG